MKRKVLIITLCFLGIFNLFGKDFKTEATELLQNGNFEQCFTLLKEWEKEEPKNLEINIYYFNYYMQRNAQHFPTMGQMKDGRYGMYDRVEYNLKDVAIAVSYFDKILKKQPNRLDVRSSKCTAYIYSEQYDLACNTLIEIIELSKKNKNNWTWSENKSPKEIGMPKEGEDLLFSVINECFYGIYYPFESNKDLIRKIIEKELELYPDNTWGLNHAARYYREIGNYKKSIEVLKHAVELDPNDYIVVGNLGYTYELDEDYLNAKKWYEYMLKMDNPDAVEYGKQGLEIIKGKY
ncbi:MAG: hypothetical protein J5710_02845 [Treponema sp.]|nr:hypothetical protein [Treponema sp.]MBR5645016.1 hypothetical protein [Treponema sp.]